MNGNCPVCSLPLTSKNVEHNYDIQYCEKCHREFYPVKEQNKNKLEYDGLELVSEGEPNPILLCLNGDITNYYGSKANKDVLKQREQERLRRTRII